MAKKISISQPANYVAPTALGFADSAGELSLVTTQAPLPVILAARSSAASKPLEGKTTKSMVAGPFKPVPDVPIHLQLSGDWTGRVTVERSTDGAPSRQGLTLAGARWASFSGNVNEPIWQEGAQGTSLWLDIQLERGTLSYRVSQ